MLLRRFAFRLNDNETFVVHPFCILVPSARYHFLPSCANPSDKCIRGWGWTVFMLTLAANSCTSDGIPFILAIQVDSSYPQARTKSRPSTCNQYQQHTLLSHHISPRHGINSAPVYPRSDIYSLASPYSGFFSERYILPLALCAFKHYRRENHL